MTLLQTIYEMYPGHRLLLTDLAFFFVVLPLFLLVYYLAPQRMRPGVLLLESLWFYLQAEPGGLLLLTTSVAVDYAALRLMDRSDGDIRLRRLCLVVPVVKSLVLIGFYGAMAQVRVTPLILGLQVYTLSGLCCLLAAYRREIPCERNLIRFALYCSFFPKLYAGPLHSYSDYVGQLHEARLKPGEVLAGFGGFLQGAFKAGVLGGYLYRLHQDVSALQPVTALAAWMKVFTLAFSLYYLLSGLGDMARGVGAMFGLKLPGNFYYPYQSRNVEDFFDRFLITINGFIRGTVYAGLRDHRRRGKWDGAAADALNLLISGMLFGLWFGLRLNYLLWGAYLALFIILERYLYPRLLARVPTLFCRLGTLCVVLAGFTIFAGETPAESAALIRAMVDFSAPVNNQVLYLLSSNWLLLLASLFFATNLVNLAMVKLRRNLPRVAAALFGACDVGILILYLALSL